MTTATSGVLARFPLLLPVRNSYELRGLYSHSYFGPRTCDRSEKPRSSKSSPPFFDSLFSLSSSPGSTHRVSVGCAPSLRLPRQPQTAPIRRLPPAPLPVNHPAPVVCLEAHALRYHICGNGTRAALSHGGAVWDNAQNMERGKQLSLLRLQLTLYP